MTRTVSDSLLSSLDWRLIGPYRGGRVVAVAGDVADRLTFYFGACAGGVWKTIDGGLDLGNVSDGFFATAAIGALAVSISDPNVIYAGTGETTIRGNVSHGDGVYKSVDGGTTWRNMGPKDTRHIGKIQIHPENPDLVYVAAFGHAWGPNEERGVFRSNDGGETWEKVLYRSPRAGSHDVSMDPTNPRILYAAIWQAQRYPHALISGGEECGLFRSTDGGDTWEEITRNPGLPKGMLGKIGVVASPVKPGRVWAVIEAEDGAVFRSDDWGEAWTRLSEQPLLRTRPWYYMHITADTTDPDTVYVQNYSTWKSIDAGATFSSSRPPHGDEHALWIDPHDNQRHDQGQRRRRRVTFNGGDTWSTSSTSRPRSSTTSPPTTSSPTASTAHSRTTPRSALPSRRSSAIHERTGSSLAAVRAATSRSSRTNRGHRRRFRPGWPAHYNDIMTHYDHRTGQIRNITVWPELYGWGAGAEPEVPLAVDLPDPSSPATPRTRSTSRATPFRSTNLGIELQVVSPDLTRNDPEKLKASGGPITRDNTGAEVYCTIFALAESPRMRACSGPAPTTGWSTAPTTAASTWERHPARSAGMGADQHHRPLAARGRRRLRRRDPLQTRRHKPYLFKTTDNGATWTPITNGIPADDFTRVIREDPNRRGLLYAGTETGLYVSFDDGGHWRRLGGNLPVAPIHDLVIKGSSWSSPPTAAPSGSSTI